MPPDSTTINWLILLSPSAFLIVEIALIERRSSLAHMLLIADKLFGVLVGKVSKTLSPDGPKQKFVHLFEYNH